MPPSTKTVGRQGAPAPKTAAPAVVKPTADKTSVSSAPKAARKPAVPNPRVEAAQREEQQKRQAAELAEAQQRAALAADQVEAAHTHVSELEAELRAAAERENGMSVLLASIGQNSLTREPLLSHTRA